MQLNKPCQECYNSAIHGLLPEIFIPTTESLLKDWQLSQLTTKGAQLLNITAYTITIQKIYKYTSYSIAKEISVYPICSTLHMQKHITTYCKPSQCI